MRRPAAGSTAHDHVSLAMDERPLCECHGEPMYWHKRADCRAGGCWECAVKIRERVRRWREENRERHREAARRWSEQNRVRARENARRWYADNHERALEAKRRWYWRNRDQAREASREWYRRNQERHRENGRRWYQRNSDLARTLGRLKEARRRARLRDALVIPFSRDQLMQRMAYFGERCWVCGGPFEHVDHVIAIARGGPHVLANLRPICRSCNARKGARDWREWVAQAS